MKKYILLFLLISVGVAGDNPFIGLWEIKHQDQHFYTEVYFQAELGIWHFEHTSYLVGLDGEVTRRVATLSQMDGHCYYSSIKEIIICKIDEYIMNRKHMNMIDENGNPFIFVFRLTSDSTGTFGRLINNDIYEAYNFEKRRQ